MCKLDPHVTELIRKPYDTAKVINIRSGHNESSAMTCQSSDDRPLPNVLST